MKQSGKVIWRQREYMEKMNSKLERNLDITGATMVEDIKSSFGTGGFGVHAPPGSPPNIQSGDLKDSITFLRRDKTLMVGSSLQPKQGSDKSYAWFQEMGTILMSARPYLRSYLIRNRAKIVKLITAK